MIASTAQPAVLGITFYPRQWEAVASPIGPVLVLAGPGAGKTRCLTGRIGYLVDRCDVDPRSICAITFTNKAAREMQHRLHATLGDRVEELSCGTIHSLCLGLLRDHSEEAGLKRGFGVADETHQRLILKKLGIPPMRQGGVLTRFGRHWLEGYKLVEGESLVHEKYIKILDSQNLIDFNGLLYHVKSLLDNNAAVLETLQQRWDHLLIDEFQDLDPFQYAIVRHLSLGHRSLFAVGDDDQSIFSFRSADPRLINSLMTDFDIRSPIVLDINCRCARPIFDIACRILPPNQFGFDKQIAALRESDSQVRIVEFDHDGLETSWIVADLIKDQKGSGLPWGEYALLYRYHAVGEKFEQELIAAGVPCQMGKGRAITDNPMVEQLLCALRLIIDPGSWLEIERMAKAILGELLLTEVQQLPGDTLLAQARKFAVSNRNEDGKRCWKFVYLVENLRGLGGRETHLRDLISAIIAQGIGRGETPLEVNCQEISDPNDNASVRRLGGLFIQAEMEQSPILITQAGGLEYPIREMIRQALPALRVEIWTPHSPIAPNSLMLLLSEDGSQLSHLGEAICYWFSDADMCRSTQVFKALQYAGSSRSARLFDEYICFDTETTGKDTDHCEIIELAAVKVWRGEVIETFRSLIHTDRPISSEASKVHGYTAADLVGKPTLAEVWPRFRRFTGEHRLVVHNGHQFDVPVIQRLTRAWDGLHGLTLFDSLPLARTLIKDGSLKLEDLATRFGVEKGRGHHALDDSVCLAGVFERLVTEHEKRNRKTCLSNLLDCLALGLAIEFTGSEGAEDQLLLKISRSRALGPYSTLLENYNAELAEGELSGPDGDTIIERLGGKEYQRMVRQERRPEDRHPETFARLKALVEHAQAPTLRESIRQLADTLALSRSDLGADPERVNLLTCHATKGLEFSRVYVVGVEDDHRQDDLDEEREARRLMYVAMTRAKDVLSLTHCKQRNGRTTRGTRLLDDLRPASSMV